MRGVRLGKMLVGQMEGFDVGGDDRPIGQVLTRREILALLGTAGAAFLVACAPRDLVAATQVVPEATAVDGPAATPTVVGAETVGTVPLPACVVRPELTEGPYFVDEKLERSDIRSDPSRWIRQRRHAA